MASIQNASASLSSPSLTKAEKWARGNRSRGGHSSQQYAEEKRRRFARCRFGPCLRFRRIVVSRRIFPGFSTPNSKAEGSRLLISNLPWCACGHQNDFIFQGCCLWKRLTIRLWILDFCQNEKLPAPPLAGTKHLVSSAVMICTVHVSLRPDYPIQEPLCCTHSSLFPLKPQLATILGPLERNRRESEIPKYIPEIYRRNSDGTGRFNGSK